MKVMLVDDEQPMLDELNYWLAKYPDVQIIAAFDRPRLAVDYIKERIVGGLELPDVVFLDIEMPQVDGLETAREIQFLLPDIITIFITAHSSYALQSFEVHPLDYLLKPLQHTQLEATLNHIRRQLQLLGSRPYIQKPVYINCFGRFQLSLPGKKEVKWGTRRVKELFMYLVDRGEVPAKHNDLLQEVFGGHSKKTNSNLYVTVHKLRQLVQLIDPKGEYLNLKNDIVLEIAPGICDYADFIKFARRNPVINSHNVEAAEAALQLCSGSYMPDLDYPWAEQTAHTVDIEYERIALALVTVYTRTGNYQEAENLLLNLIARNPLSEEGFTTLLDIYIRTNRPQDFALVYEQYSRMMKTELDEKPSEKYRLYLQTLDQT